MRTRLTELLGIKHPLIKPGMGMVSDVRLVAAVCNAGGLGFLPTSAEGPEDMRQQIHQIRELVGNKPFGCNISPLVPDFGRFIDVWIQEKVPVWGSAIRDIFRPLGIKKPKDIIYIPTVGTPQQAKRMEELGADAVLVHCVEGGGHPGSLGASVFIPRAAEVVKVPVIPAGGFCDGKGMAAALALGAEGIGMGTRFMMTRESRLPDEAKKRFLATEVTEPKLSTVYDGIAARAIEGYDIAPYRGWWTHPWDLPYEFLHLRKKLGISLGQMLAQARALRGVGSSPLQALAGVGRFEKGLVEGDVRKGLLYVGQVVGRVDDIPTCKELVERVVREAEETIAAMAHRFPVSP